MATTANAGPGPGERHVLRDLGFATARSGDELHGSATIVDEMHVPGTEHLRTSILAIWTDTLAGLLAVDATSPRVPVTLELDIHLFRPAPGSGVVHGVGKIVKSGRTVMVAGVDFTDGGGGPIGFGAASFMAAPDSRLVFTSPTSLGQSIPEGSRLDAPFAERAGCERQGPGEAVLARSDQMFNSSDTVNGGLIALTAEEAALSLCPGATLASLALRYLQPVRMGPTIAVAEVRDGLGRIEVRDDGNDGRLCVVATSRTFPTQHEARAPAEGPWHEARAPAEGPWHDAMSRKGTL
jgi:acyl-coenzyme A thioesterase PaaI-like protein